MTELLAIVTDLRPPVDYVYYDMLQGRTVPTKVRRNPKCVVCAYVGYGPDIHLERYQIEDEPEINVGA